MPSSARSRLLEAGSIPSLFARVIVKCSSAEATAKSSRASSGTVSTSSGFASRASGGWRLRVGGRSGRTTRRRASIGPSSPYSSRRVRVVKGYDPAASAVTRTRPDEASIVRDASPDVANVGHASSTDLTGRFVVIANVIALPSTTSSRAGSRTGPRGASCRPAARRSP